MDGKMKLPPRRLCVRFLSPRLRPRLCPCLRRLPPPCRRTPCTSTAPARAGRSGCRRKPCTRTGTGRASRSSRRRCRRANSPCIGSAGARARIASPCAHRFGELPALRRALQKTAPTLSARFGAHALAVAVQKKSFFRDWKQVIAVQGWAPTTLCQRFQVGPPGYNRAPSSVPPCARGRAGVGKDKSHVRSTGPDSALRNSGSELITNISYCNQCIS